MQIIPPLPRWILFAVLLAAISALPAFAEEESSGITWITWVLMWVTRLLPDVVVGVVAGVVTVLLAAWQGFKNFRKGMRHNKKAEIYERLLAALNAQRDAYNAVIGMHECDMLHHSPRTEQQEQERKEREREKDKEAEKAHEDWSRAIAVAKLYLPPKSVNALRGLREEAGKKIGESGAKADKTGDQIGYMRDKVSLLGKLAEEVQKQAEKDLR